MQIMSVHHCAETHQVTVLTTKSSTAITAKCLGVLAKDGAGNPTHLVLDRLLFCAAEQEKLTGLWSANGCFVTELSRNL